MDEGRVYSLSRSRRLNRTPRPNGRMLTSPSSIAARSAAYCSSPIMFPCFGSRCMCWRTCFAEIA